MGVRRLTSLVERLVWGRHAIHDERPPPESIENLPPSSVVLLDGNGFIGWVCSHVDAWASAPSGPAWMLRGGDYAAVDSLVRAWVHTFSAHGVHTLAVFDSYAGAAEASAKASTGDSRRAGRADDIAECLAFCAEPTAAAGGRLGVPYPRLLARQVRASLAAAGAWVLHAPGEADGLMLRLSHAGHLSLPLRPGSAPLPPLPVACLIGNDSDFFVSDRCRYVPLNWMGASFVSDGALTWLRLEVALVPGDVPPLPLAPLPPTLVLVGEAKAGAAEGLPALRLPVISPADVAAALGLPPRRLLELAALAGNDFTGPHLAPYPPPRLPPASAAGAAAGFGGGVRSFLEAESAMLMLLAEARMRAEEGDGPGAEDDEPEGAGAGAAALDGPDPLGVHPVLRRLRALVSSAPPPLGFPACARLYAPLEAEDILAAVRLDVLRELGVRSMRHSQEAAQRASIDAAQVAAAAAAAVEAESEVGADVADTAVEEDDAEVEGDDDDAVVPDGRRRGVPVAVTATPIRATGAIARRKVGTATRAAATPASASLRQAPDVPGPVEVAAWIRETLCCCLEDGGAGGSSNSCSGLEDALAQSLAHLTIGGMRTAAPGACSRCARPQRLGDVPAVRRVLLLRPRLAIALQHSQGVAEGVAGSSYVDCVAAAALGGAPELLDGRALTTALANSELLQHLAPALLPPATLYCTAPRFAPARHLHAEAEGAVLVALQKARLAAGAPASLAEALLPAAAPLPSTCFPTPPGESPGFDLAGCLPGVPTTGRSAELCLEDVLLTAPPSAPRLQLLLLPLDETPLNSAADAPAAVEGYEGSYASRLGDFLRWATTASHAWRDSAWAEWSEDGEEGAAAAASPRPSHWLKLPPVAAPRDLGSVFASTALSLLSQTADSRPFSSELLAALTIRHFVAAASHRFRLARGDTEGAAAFAAAAAAMPRPWELSAVAVTVAFCSAASSAAGLEVNDSASLMRLLSAVTSGIDTSVAAGAPTPSARALSLRNVTANTWVEGTLAELLARAEELDALRRPADASGAADGACPARLLLEASPAAAIEAFASAAAAREPSAACHPLALAGAVAAAAAASARAIPDPVPSRLWHGPLFTALLALLRPLHEGGGDGSRCVALSADQLSRLADAAVLLALPEDSAVVVLREAVRTSAGRIWAAALAGFDLDAVCADQAAVLSSADVLSAELQAVAAGAAGALPPTFLVPSQAAVRGATLSSAAARPAKEKKEKEPKRAAVCATTPTATAQQPMSGPPPPLSNVLPILEHRRAILAAIAGHTVSVVKGDTGSGAFA